LATVARADLVPAPGARRASAGLWTNAWYSLRRDRLTMGAAVVLLLLALSAIAAPLFAEYVFHTTFGEQDLLHIYAKPTLDPPAYLLGALMNLTLGVGLGLLAGYLRGTVDDVITWFITTLNSIPIIFLLLLITSLFQPSALTLTFIIGVLFWTGVTNFVRGQTFALREREFVIAARTIGAATPRILFRHILPNVLPLIFVLAAIDIGTIILAESALSYLGLGVMPPTPSWGNMLSNAQSYATRAPWLVVAPGAMIFLTVLCLYLIGDGLRDALDPRLKTS
jgi:peptide/nickel transport system permease protein